MRLVIPFVFAVLALICMTNADELADDQPPADVKAYIDFMDKYRKNEIVSFRSQLKSSKEKAERERIRKLLRAAESGDDYETRIELDVPFAQGQFGRIDNAKVIQLGDDPGSILARVLFRNQEKLVWIDGINTDSITDGDAVQPKDLIFRVLPNKQYVSVTGATQTVLHVEPFDMDRLAEWRRNHPRQKAKAKKR